MVLLHGLAAVEAQPAWQAAPVAALEFRQDMLKAQFGYAYAAGSTPSSPARSSSGVAPMLQYPYEKEVPVRTAVQHEGLGQRQQEGQKSAGGKAFRLNLPPAAEPRSTKTTRSNSIMAHLWEQGEATRLALVLAGLMAAGAMIAQLCLMVPARGPGASYHRIPPSWDPANDHNYSFRTWVQDLQLWLLVTELQPHQQAAAIVIHLRGQPGSLPGRSPTSNCSTATCATARCRTPSHS